MARPIRPVCGLSVKQTQWLRARWQGMRDRCSPRSRAAKNYHDRGIRVCDAWAAFDGFAAYVVGAIGVPDFDAARWTLDRIDNDRGYEPGNIRWASYVENLRNRRGTVRVDLDGESLTLSELAERTGLSYYLLHDRIVRYGWTARDAITAPIDKTQRVRSVTWKHEIRIEHNGETLTAREWAQRRGVPRQLLLGRLARGWTFEQAASLPADKGHASKARAQRVRYEDRDVTLKELAALTGVKEATLAYRIRHKGMTAEQAVSVPLFKARGLGSSLSSRAKDNVIAEQTQRDGLR